MVYGLNGVDKTDFHRPWNSQLAEVIKKLISKLGLSDKLLLTFAAAALLTVAIASIGWLSFQEVVSTQRAITSDAIPATGAVQTLARSNTRIITIAPQFSRVEDRQEYTRIQGLLQDHVARMQYLLGDLEERRFEPELRSKLADTVHSIERDIGQQAALVRDRLDLEQREWDLIDAQRNAAQELVTLSESMVANASTSITSIISSLYSIVGRTDDSGSTAYDALDRLLEVDVDNMERMSEFQLTCFQLKALIEQLEDAVKTKVVSRIESLFRANLEVLDRRVEDINDPHRREIARKHFRLLVSATATGGLFDTRRTRLALIDDIARLQQLGNEHSSRLNEQANGLLSAAADAIDNAGLEAERAVDRGLTGFLTVAALLLLTLIITLWALMRHHIVRRLHGMELAVKAISTGDLDVDISTAGDDELAQLGKALEQLRKNARERERLEDELHRYQRNLEGQVDQRTAELKQSNTLLGREATEHALARKRAEDASRAKTTFLATMSHELRTPLSGVLGTLQLLGDTGLDEQQWEYIRMIRAANTTLLEILEDMLGYSKLEAGKLDSEYTPFLLRETIDNILSLQALRAQSKNIALIREIDDTVPERITGDRPKLNQILLNLVGNAIKFTDEGSVTVSVKSHKMETERGEIPMTFTVTDTGIGIPDSKCKDVFNPFYQVADTAHRRHGGTGLGLTICKKLVEAMGGEIWIESDPGKGASVSFQLSFAPAPEESRTDTEIMVSPSLHPAQPLTVLVVEDDEINRRVCTHYLESLGHRPLVARDGVEALTLLQQQIDPIDVILMDISLPGSSGIEVAVEIRALPDTRWEEVPIIAMSAHVFGDTVESYYASGMVGFLSKPFDRDQLNQALYSATSSHMDKKISTPPGAIEITLPDADRQSLLNIDYIDEELETLGHKLFEELLTLFTREAGGTLDSLNTLAEAEKWMGLSRHAHRLKSAAGNLGMSRLVEQTQQLEKTASMLPVDGNVIAAQIGILRETCNNSCSELDKRVSGKRES